MSTPKLTEAQRVRVMCDLFVNGPAWGERINLKGRVGTIVSIEKVPDTYRAGVPLGRAIRARVDIDGTVHTIAPYMLTDAGRAALKEGGK